jgi:uncharacterized damage-inducible protein DinB
MMVHTITEFEHLWESEVKATQKILRHLTGETLSFAGDPDGRTIGRVAWHIVTTIPEMMTRTGLKVVGPLPTAPVPGTPGGIFEAYTRTALSLLEQIKDRWDDATLQLEDDMYGERWSRATTLQALILHQVHHRGQLTVLMRMAHLSVPGVYGPARHEWAAYGMQPPAL